MHGQVRRVFLGVATGIAAASLGVTCVAGAASAAGRTPVPATPRGPGTAYVANFGDGTVTPFSTSTNEAGAPIQVGAQPDAIVVTPDGKTAYVAEDSQPGAVTPIRTATSTAGHPIAVGASDAVAIAITPNGKTAYVVCANAQPDGTLDQGTVTPVSTATDKAGRPIYVGYDPSAIVVTPNGKTAYVINTDSQTVTPISTATNKAGAPIQLWSFPVAVVITPNGKDRKSVV